MKEIRSICIPWEEYRELLKTKHKMERIAYILDELESVNASYIRSIIGDLEETKK